MDSVDRRAEQQNAQQSTAQQQAAPAPPRLQLSATQIAASALAAITATVAGSFLGVSGTIIGAAVASVISVVGNAVYSHSIHRTRAALPGSARRGGRPATPTSPSASQPPPVSMPTWSAPTVSRAGRRTGGRSRASGRGIAWRRLALGTTAMFLVLIGVLTSIELALGRPLDDLFNHDGGSGTSVSQLVSGTRKSPPPAPTTAPPAATATVPAPTVTVTATPDTTPSATLSSSSTPSSTPSATPTNSASATPSATPTPSAAVSGNQSAVAATSPTP